MKKILLLVLVSFLCVSVISPVFSVEKETERYADIFKEYIMNNGNEVSGFIYRNIYEYYDLNQDDNKQTKPDYVLVFAADGPGQPAEVTRLVGDYLVFSTSWYSPYDLGLYIYVPDLDEIYTIEDAYEAKIMGIDKAFENLENKCVRKGDVDFDKKISIRDATTLQKLLADLPVASIEDIREYVWVGNYDKELKDFNGDGGVTIHDVTAIQKYLAGIE